MLTDKTHPASLPAKFQKYFWDVAFDELSFEKFPRFIAERLLNYGDLSDMKWLLSQTDPQFIGNLIKTSRNLNDKTKNFWQSILSHKSLTFSDE